MVLVWSVRVRERGSTGEDAFQTWGGITVFHLDADGRIVAEIGEESGPGPVARMRPQEKPRGV